MAGGILQIVLGRILLPRTHSKIWSRALRQDPDHDLSAEELAAVSDLEGWTVGRELADDLGQILAMTTASDRLSAASDWARQRIGRGKYAIACTFPRHRPPDRRSADSRVGPPSRHSPA